MMIARPNIRGVSLSGPVREIVVEPIVVEKPAPKPAPVPVK
jgi:hypothetical protein